MSAEVVAVRRAIRCPEVATQVNILNATDGDHSNPAVHASSGYFTRPDKGYAAQAVPLSMNRPTPDPSQDGSRHSSGSCPFPAWEGLGVGSWSQCMRKSERRLPMSSERDRMCLADALSRCISIAGHENFGLCLAIVA